MKAYAQGESGPQLIEETIGANFERTAARFGPVEALVEAATGRRWSWSELDAQINRL
ncbi:MAG: AMP-binding protein, partial [Glutamicibacter arilaitensis]